MRIAKHTADGPILTTLAAALTGAPAAFLFATSWLPDPETGRIALQQALLLWLCALVGGCVIALACRGHRAARAALVHPATLVPLAIAALALLLAPFHPFPWRTVEGLPTSPYHHAGALFHVEIGVLAAGYVVAARGPWRTPLLLALAAAVLAAGGVTAATISFDRQPWLAIHLPHWYGFFSAHVLPSGYLAWIAPAGLAAAAALHAGGRGHLPRIAAGTLAIWALWASNNSTAAIGVAGAAAWLVLVRAFPRFGGFPVRAAVCSAILLLPLLLVPAAAPLIERADTKGLDARVAGSSDGIPSLDPRDHVEINMMPGRTIWSRSRMQRIVLDDLAARPALFATGRGWGTFAESHAAHWRDVPGRRFRDVSPLASKTHWDAHTSARFHPHNTLIETVSSLGLPGGALVALWLALPALFPRRPSKVPILFGIALCTIAGFWFIESAFAPALAAAYALTVRPLRLVAYGTGRAAFAVALSLCLAGGALSLSQAHPPTVAGCEPPGTREPASFAGYDAFLSEGRSAPVPLLWVSEHVRQIDAMACAARANGAPGGGLDALSEMLRLRDHLLTGFEDLPADLFQPEFSAWKSDLSRLLDEAPGRTDAIVPYAARTVSTQDRETAVRELAALRARVVGADDPVGPWLDACRSFLDGDADGHRRNGLRALELGIANLVAPRHAYACAPRPPGPGPLHSAGEGATTIR